MRAKDSEHLADISTSTSEWSSSRWDEVEPIRMPAAISSHLGDDPSLFAGFMASTAPPEVFEISTAAKGAMPWRTLRPHSMLRTRSTRERDGRNRSRSRSGISPPGSGRRGARRRGRWRHARATATASRPPIGLIRSSCWTSKPPPACPSWSRSATGECWSRRSRSSAGAAYLMAADLAEAPRTGLEVQLCGDAHLSNFGAFAAARSAAGVQHQRLRRDAAGPVRVGRKRLVASFAVAGRDRGFDAK